MNDTEKIDDSIYYEKVPGTGGIISTIFFAVFGTLLVIWSLCYATNFICEFAGIDFNAFIWAQQFYDSLPELLESWMDTLLELIDTVKGLLE